MSTKSNGNGEGGKSLSPRQSMTDVLRLRLGTAAKMEAFKAKLKSKKSKMEPSREELLSNLYEALHPSAHQEYVQKTMKDIMSALKFPWEELFLKLDENGHLPLHIAILNQCSFETIETVLLAMPKAAQIPDNEGNLALHLAASTPSTSNESAAQIVSLLIHVYHDALLQKGPNECLPIHIAAKYGAPVEVVSVLLQHCNRAVQLRNKDGFLPVHLAAEAPTPYESLVVIIDAFPEGLKKRNASKHSELPIHLALAVNSTSAKNIRLLVDKFPEALAESNIRGNLPLHCACCNANLTAEVLEYLIDQYPSALLAPDDSGGLPVHKAAKFDLPVELINILIQYSPTSVTAVDDGENLPLHLAVKFGASHDAVSALIDAYPVGVRQRNGEGATYDLPLFIALRSNRVAEDVVQLLLDNYPESIKECTPRGRLAIHCAASNPNMHIPILTLIMKAFPEGVDTQDKEGNLPLHLCAGNKDVTMHMIRYMISPLIPNIMPAYQRLSTKNKLGMLPLHMAAFANPSAQVINLLIAGYKEGLTVPDLEGRLPLHHSVRHHSSTDPESPVYKIQSGPSPHARLRSTSSMAKKGKLSAYDLIRMQTKLNLLAAGAIGAIGEDDESEECERSSASPEVVYALLDAYPAGVKVADKKGHIPLHTASQYKTDPHIINMLLDAYKFGAQRRAHSGAVPITLALEREGMLPEEAIIELLNAYPDCVQLRNSSNILIQDILKVHYSPSVFDNWCIKHEVTVINHLSLCERPVVVLHRVMPWLIEYFRSLFAQQCISVLFILTKFIISLRNACGTHGADAYHITKNVLPVFEQLLVSVFDCPSMDNTDNVVTLLLNRDRKISDHHGKAYRYHEALNSGLLAICIKHDIKVLFPCTQISNIIEDISYKHLGEPYHVFPELWHIKTIRGHHKVPKMLSSGVLQNIGLLSMNLRSSPVAMFLLEGLSKLFTLLLIRFAMYCDSDTSITQCTGSRVMLMVMIGATILYEAGQVAEGDWIVQHFYANLWNRYDTTTLVCLVVWAISVVSTTRRFGDDIERVSLSLACIPLCLSLLKYLSLKKSLGILVISIGEMFYDMFNFFIVLLVISFGFAMTFYGLFYSEDTSGASNFSSIPAITRVLYENTLGEIDFTVFNNSRFEGVGVVCLGLYIAVTAIVLLNLVIAVMSTTYERISQFSTEEWSAVKSASTRTFMLVQERHPLCMLPPPLNVISTLLYPLHVYAYSDSNSGAIIPKNVSIAGTVSNVILAYIGAIPRIIALILHHTPGTHRGILSMILLGIPRLILLILHTVFVAPLRNQTVVVHLVDQMRKPSILPFIDYRYHEKMGKLRQEEEAKRVAKAALKSIASSSSINGTVSIALDRKGSQPKTFKDKIASTLSLAGLSSVDSAVCGDMPGEPSFNFNDSDDDEEGGVEALAGTALLNKQISLTQWWEKLHIEDAAEPAKSRAEVTSPARRRSTILNRYRQSQRAFVDAPDVTKEQGPVPPGNGDKEGKCLHPGRSYHSLKDTLVIPLASAEVPFIARKMFSDEDIDHMFQPLVTKLLNEAKEDGMYFQLAEKLEDTRLQLADNAERTRKALEELSQNSLQMQRIEEKIDALLQKRGTSSPLASASAAAGPPLEQQTGPVPVPVPPSFHQARSPVSINKESSLVTSSLSSSLLQPAAAAEPTPAASTPSTPPAASASQTIGGYFENVATSARTESKECTDEK